MAINLSALFGQQPDYSQFISPAETQRMQSGAGQQALLNAAIALLGQSGQTRQPISTGQVLGSALGAGMEGYNQSFDRSLKQMVTNMQLEEFKRKRQAQEMARGAITQTPVPIPMATGQGSQLEMLSRPEFGGDITAAETVGALRANLPTKTSVDINKLIQAIAVTDPVEAAKLMSKEPKESFRPLSTEEKKAFGLPQDQSFQVSSSGKIDQISKGELVKNIIGGAETEYSKFVGKTKGERDYSTFDAAQKAAGNLPKINATLNELQTSDAITGLGSEVFKNIERAKATFLADKKAGKKVTDTEYLDALLGSDIFPMISSLGIGAKGLDTPAEREFLRQVMTGTTSMNKDTLVKLTQLRKDIEERAINRFNEKLESGELDKFFTQTGERKQVIQVPSAPGLPPGVKVRKKP
jgi:hypothetical protein